MRKLVGRQPDRERRLGRIGEILAKAVASARAAHRAPVVKAIPKEETDEIVCLVGKHNVLSISQIMELANLSRTSAHRRLVSLVASGKLVSKGKARATRYSLPIQN